MGELEKIYGYRKPSADLIEQPIEQPVFDDEAGWIEMRRYGDGYKFVAWCVRIKAQVPRRYLSVNSGYEENDYDLCVIRVPILSKKFDKLNRKARQRALDILRAWRGTDTEAGT